jgi:hypothetical protein
MRNGRLPIHPLIATSNLALRHLNAPNTATNPPVNIHWSPTKFTPKMIQINASLDQSGTAWNALARLTACYFDSS